VNRQIRIRATTIMILTAQGNHCPEQDFVTDQSDQLVAVDTITRVIIKVGVCLWL